MRKRLSGVMAILLSKPSIVNGLPLTADKYPSINCGRSTVVSPSFNIQHVKFIIYHLSIIIFLCNSASSQPLPVSTIHIHVQNPSAQPVQGVSVRLSRSAAHTVTDASGNADCIVRLPDTLILTHIGYDGQRIPLSLHTNLHLNITIMPATTVLQQVTVNTGYQSIPKERATGSFVQVDNNLFNRTLSTNILDRLETVVPSLLVDKRTANNTIGQNNITIRGLSTFFSGTAPLVVVDNFPYDGDLSNINPNDVESVTVLKDAAATSIWGAKAGNGVIVINTKKTAYNQPLRITFNANTSIKQKPNLGYLPQMSSTDFIEVEQLLFSKGFYNADISNTSGRPVLSPVVEILAQQRNGLLSPADAAARINALKNLDVRNDFNTYYYTPEIRQQYALSMGSGNNGMNYLFSVGYDHNNGSNNLSGNNDNRLTLRFSNSLKITPKLEIQATLNYALTNSFPNSPGAYTAITTGSGKSMLYPYAQLADVNGTPLSIAKDYRAGYTDTAGAGRLLDWKYRPLAEKNLADNRIRSQDALLNINARYTVNKWLHAEIKYQYENTSASVRNYYSPATYFTRNLVNRFTQLNGNTVKRVVPYGGILDNAASSLVANDIRGQLNLNLDKDPANKITAIAGGEIREAAATANKYRVYGYNDDILTYANIDYVNTYPIYGGLSSNSTIPSNISFSDNLNRFVSVYANAAYNRNNRYILSASARKDASNLFGVSTNLKGVPLWSAGFAWLLSSEKFYKVSILPYLKLRATYGYSGNTDNSRSALSTLSYALYPDNLTNLFYSNVSNPPNPSLSWEKIKTLNLGIDFFTRNKRISGSIEYYHKTASNLLCPTPVDPSTGFSTLTLNNGGLIGKGVDAELHTVNIKGMVMWTSDILFSYAANKVTYYSGTTTVAGGYAGSGLGFSPLVGQSAYTLYSYQWAGLDPATGDPQGYLNKQVSKDYLGIKNAPFTSLLTSGTVMPLYFGAIRNTLSWNQLSLSVNISYRLGYCFRRSTINYTALFNQWQGHSEYAQRWQQPGDELKTNVPSLVYPANSNRDELYNYSSATVEKGDHIRLQDIRLDYSFRNKKAATQSFQNIQVYCFAANLGIIWRANKKGIDPDYASGYLPPSPLFAIGIRTNIQPVK